MPKRKLDEAEEDFEDEEDLEEEDEEEEPKKKIKPKVKSNNWEIRATPEIFTAYNPKTNEVIAQALSKEDLIMQLVLVAAQKATETVKNTE